LPDTPPIVVNGWTLYAHSLFVEQFEVLTEKVEKLKAKVMLINSSQKCYRQAIPQMIGTLF